MIVKKMPVLQGFLDLDTVKFLSNGRAGSDSFQPAFYDIETTGLSKTSTSLYLIGAAAPAGDGKWMLFQWMAETPKEEPGVLRAFSEFLSDKSCLVSYNGERFDMPYLEARYALYGLPSPFAGKDSLDLYLHLKPLKSLLKLPRTKQPDMESFLGIPGRVYCDGRDCIRLYQEFLKTRDFVTAETVLGHNLEDVLGLGRIYAMLGYLSLYEGSYEVTECCPDEEHLLLGLTLPCALPMEFSNGTDAFYITGRDTSVRLIIKTAEGRLRRYYADYKNYDYLPAEDTAIPKALSACMDRKLRKSATRDTCYTWFSCTEEFRSKPALQKQYLSQTLPYLLGTLK